MADFDSTSVVNFMSLGGDKYAGSVLTPEGEEVVTATVPEGERFKWATWSLATEEVAKAYREWYAAIEAKRQLEEAAYPSSYEEGW
jgi:hypothetical protein